MPLAFTVWNLNLPLFASEFVAQPYWLHLLNSDSLIKCHLSNLLQFYGIQYHCATPLGGYTGNWHKEAINTAQSICLQLLSGTASPVYQHVTGQPT